MEQYLASAERSDEILRPGLWGTDLSDALSDQDTIVCEESGMPIATPLQHNSWLRPEYFDRQIEGANIDGLYVYVGWPALWKEMGVDAAKVHTQMIEEIADRKMGLVFEQSPVRDTRAELEVATKQIAGSSFVELTTQGLTPDGTLVTYRPRHHIFVGRYFGATPNINPRFSDLYQTARSDNDETSIRAVVDDVDVEKLYSEYVEAFSNTRHHDPIEAVLSLGGFDECLKSPEVMKLLQEDDRGVASMCFITDVRKLDYILSGYFERRYPKQLARGEVLCSTVAYTRVDATKGRARSLFQAAPEAFWAAGMNPLLVLECNDVSWPYIPRTFQRAAIEAGVSKLALGNPAVVQSVELLTVS